MVHLYPFKKIAWQPVLMAAAWILLVTSSFAWNWISTEKFFVKIAETEARSTLNKIILYRRWVAMHGGVYIQPTDTTPPNPYLSHLPDRDIITTSGKHLTLVNPAYMTRQIGELSEKQYGTKWRITSLRPVRPKNAPDPWEKSALQAIENGKKEVISIETTDRIPYLRIMQPLYTEQPCLKCHAANGYRAGDIRGGISIAVPLNKYMAAAQHQRLILTLAHLILGILGLIALFVGFNRINKKTDALKEREEQLRTLINATPDIICFKDGKGRWIETNTSNLKLFSLEDVAYKGKRDSELAEFTDPIYKQAFLTCEETDEQTWQAGEMQRGEEVIPLTDGTKITLDVIKVPLFHENGDRKGLMVIGRDITEQIHADAHRRILISAIEQSDNSIIITDKHADIQYVNRAFELITGYSREEAVGKNPRILKSGEQDPGFYKELWTTITSGKTWHGRFVNRKKDGSLFTEDASISPVHDDSGHIIRYIAVKQNITDKLKLEEENRLLEEQYQQAQKLESVGRLAGGVAHDINNMLTPIRGYCELLLPTFDKDDKRLKFVKHIQQSGKRASDIVRQLLAFSRKQTMEMKPLNMNELLSDFIKFLRRTIGEDIEIELELASSIPSIIGDKGQIEQVVMNIAINAKDAMPDGGTLMIETSTVYLDNHYASAHQGVKPGEYVMLVISDTGYGMDAKIKANIFEPFFTTKKKDKGTGLGLATVYGIVKQHGGNIWVYSEQDIGTTFKLYFPVSRGADVSLDDAHEETQPLPLHEGNATILVVEDEQDVRELIMAALSEHGYTVIAAENGHEALNILNSDDQQIDLLLTDIIMPGMNGKRLSDMAREIYPDLKVIYMSGYPENLIYNKGVLEKDTFFMHKPFSVVDLSAKIREALG